MATKTNLILSMMIVIIFKEEGTESQKPIFGFWNIISDDVLECLNISCSPAVVGLQ